MKILLLLFISFSIGVSFSQVQDSILIDNLKQIIKSDTSSFNTKINAQEKSITLLDKQENDSISAYARYNLSEIYSKEKYYKKAIPIIDTLLSKYPTLNDKNKDFFIESKADILKKNGETDIAVKLLLDLVQKYEENNQLKKAGSLHQKIGIIFLKIQDYKSARYHLNDAKIIAGKINDMNLMAGATMSMGNSYKSELNFDAAEKEYIASIGIARKYGIKRTLAGNYNNLGSNYRLRSTKNEDKKEEYLVKALEYYFKAVKINTEINNDSWLSYNYNNIGNVYTAQGKNNKAIKYFTLSNEIKLANNQIFSYAGTLGSIADVQQKLGMYQQSYENLKKSIQLKDSIQNSQNKSEAKRVAAEFQAEQREAKIKELNLQDEISKREIKARDERISYQNFLAWLMGIGIFLILLIAVIIYISMLNKKKAHVALLEKNRKIDEQHKEIIDSINYAKRIQNSILPAKSVLSKSLKDYGLLYTPKDIVSGDFYLCKPKGDLTFFGVVDCTGHGVPGAMVSLVASNFFNKTVNELEIFNPGKILNQLNLDIPNALSASDHTVNDGMDLSLCSINRKSLELNFAGGNLDCWILNEKENITARTQNSDKKVYISGNHGIIRLKGDRQGIGKSSTQSVFKNHTFQLHPGDKIILTSDGYPDQFGGEFNKKFKIKEMRNLILKNGNNNCSDLTQILSNTLKNWQRDYDQVDDICVFVVEI